MKAISVKVERDKNGRFKKWEYAPLKDRFLANIDKSCDCWLWTGAKNKQGYGHLKIKGKTYRAHRVSYELFNGKIPPGFLVMHKCDNPLCVNPNHLKLGTHKDNTQDMMEKGRDNVDYHAAQLLGAKAKKRKTMMITLPKVVDGVKKLIAQNIKPTQRACRSIKRYSSIQRYISQPNLIKMAKGEKEIVCEL